MMPTSGSCRPSKPARSLFAGFTLLELLIVLALTAVMVALVAPRLAGTVEAIQVSGDRDDVTRRISRLPVNVRLSGEPARFDAKADLSSYLQLPEGWAVVADTPLSVSALGICSAADITVSGPRGSEKWSVLAPDCSVRETRDE